MRVKNQPIFRRILVPLMILILVEVLIFAGAVLSTRVTDNLSAYAVDVADGKLTARKNYLESVMINNWMNVTTVVTELNSTMNDMVNNGELTIEDIGKSGEATDQYLVHASELLLSMMRGNRVTGGFVLLNTQSLTQLASQAGNFERNIPGVYLRDVDPLSAVSEKNTDILIELSPAAVVKSSGIATDKNWTSMFRFTHDTGYYPFFSKPFQTAYVNKGKYEWRDLGYWSAPYKLEGEGRSAISYSVPLMLEDGTVYGVMGADILVDYLDTLLPSDELAENNEGTYFIAEANEDKNSFTEVIETGSTEWSGDTETTHNGNSNDEKTFIGVDRDQFYHSAQELKIYSSNVPYDDTHWVMGAVLPWSSLRENSIRVFTSFGLAAAGVFIIGFLGSIFVAFLIQKPVRKMEEQLRGADSNSEVKLEPTGIQEIDEMSQAIELLSANVLDAGRKFSKIIRMASEEMGGFQIDQNTDTLFITDGFFEVFGKKRPAKKTITVEEFKEQLVQLAAHETDSESDLEGQVYEIEKNGKKRYVRLRQYTEQGITYGLAEDVTQMLLRRRMLVFERDHDALTGLLNRKAFHLKITDFLDSRSWKYKYGALLMMDLDNLKSINDNYGHERGDDYIRTAANIISVTTREHAISSRISGDEFNVFFYGNSKEEIMAKIEQMREAFKDAVITITDDMTRHVKISAGIAWYPQDAHSYEELLRFADSALYVAKKSHKGEFETFDLESYKGEGEVQVRREALVNVLEEEKFHYVFQPIVSAKTGKVFAFEALMRPDAKEFSSPVDLLETARAEGKLGQVENITVPKAIETFFTHREEKRFDKHVKLFFNTISNQKLTEETRQRILKTAGSHLGNLVMELTEDEPIDYTDWEAKTGWLLSGGGALALDDYGTGYNSEKTLLAISPSFIKVDIAIVRNIQNSPDKRSIMEYIVNYAHERGKYIIAEGVEDEAETRTCIQLGADFLQGYFVSKPMDLPRETDEETMATIKSLNV